MNPDDEPAPSPLRSHVDADRTRGGAEAPDRFGHRHPVVDLFFDRVPFGLAVGGFGYAILRQRTDAVWLLAGLHALSDLLLPTTGLHGAPCGWCSSATTSHSWSGAS